MKIEFHGDTDIGQVRQINEDAFILLPSVHVMVVCDGMGGHAAGEVASREALQTFSLYFAADPERYAERLDFVTADQLPPGARHLVRAARLANRRIFNIAQQNASHRGMGTTIVAMCFEGGVVSISHVGDSRAYRFRNGKLERMTVDHSLVAELVAKQEITEEESRTFAERNVITRALGTRPGVDVDIRVEQTSPADIYLACSDGLCGFVEDEVIARTIAEAGGNLQAVAKNLIAAANAAGGEDNITVALARVDDTGTIEYQARNAATVADADGAAEAVADEVLAELATMAPPEKEEEDDTQKVPISDPPPAKAERKPPTPGGVRWLIWLIVLAAVTVFIFMGGTNLLVPANNERSTSPAVSPADSTSATPSLLFSAEDRALLEATVYVDNRPVGLAADFQHKGLKISPGPQHIKCILGSTTILDSTIDIQAGIQRVALTDAHKNLPLQ